MNIFVDGSYSSQKKIGVGAYIIVSSDELATLTGLTISDLKVKLSNEIVYVIFKDAKGSTDVEQRILESALADPKIITAEKLQLTVYTDCHKTKSTDSYTVIYVKGHTKQTNRNNADKLFDVIDKAVRKKLRKTIDELNFDM